jgi:hypothetical protein
MITEEDEKNLNEWCANAIKQNLTLSDVRRKFLKYPKDVRKYVLKTFKKMKGGLIKMPLLKKKKEEPIEEIEEEEEEQEEEEFEEEEEELPPRKNPAPVQPKLNPNWFLDVEPQKFRVIDPVKKRIMLETSSAEELNLQLLIKIYQRLMERL